jgi:hypothetical protein
LAAIRYLRGASEYQVSRHLSDELVTRFVLKLRQILHENQLLFAEGHLDPPPGRVSG